MENQLDVAAAPKGHSGIDARRPSEYFRAALLGHLLKGLSPKEAVIFRDGRLALAELIDYAAGFGIVVMVRPPRMTAKETKSAMKLYAMGVSVDAIASRFNLSHQAVSAMANKRGFRRKRLALTEGEKAEAMALYGKGWSMKKIAFHFNVAQTSIRRLVKKLK